MTINELLALTGLTGSDEIPVWDSEASGEPTKKITAQNFAAAVKTLASLLGTGDVVNDLTSTATDKPGSANMLKTLNDKIADLVKTEVRELHFGSNSISDALWATNSKYKLIGAYENAGSGYMVLPTNYNNNVCLFAWSGDSFLKNIDKTILIHYIEQE